MHRHKNLGGFTLVEIIVTLTLLAILGGVVLPYFVGGITRGTKPLEMVKEGMKLTTVMERITAHYRRLLADKTIPVLATLHDDVLVGNDVSEIPYFGAYDPPNLKYLNFDGTTRIEEAAAGTPPACKVLKVTITHNGQSLTALFTE